MLKPLVYFDQDDAQTQYRTDEFIFGNQILVCPILNQMHLQVVCICRTEIVIITGQMI
jgi:alpha-glucosidase (family GH31 glycosyl hydrolase)